MAKRRGDRSGREELGRILTTLVGLPEDTGWAIVQKLSPAPNCTLLGGLALTAGGVAALAALRQDLSTAERWVAQVVATPPITGATDHDQFI